MQLMLGEVIGSFPRIHYLIPWCMPFLTIKELILKPFEEAVAVNRLLRRSVDPGQQEKRIFLFYRAEDKDRVISLVNIIKSLRVNVFIDYVEVAVLENEDEDALQTIRERLYLCSKAILMATPRSLPVHGFPLDFGLNGKFQFTRNVLVFPLTTHPGHWDERDIYIAYGYIQKKYSMFNFPDDWQVVFPEGDRISFKEWLLK